MTDGCALSATSSGWVVAATSPAGKCATDRDTFVALRPPGDTVGGLSVLAKDTTAEFDHRHVQRLRPDLEPAADQLHQAEQLRVDSTTRTLNIAVNAGGQIRMCDPAVDDA